MTTATLTSPHGHCSRCGKVWTLKKEQGVCNWCTRLAVCQSSTTKPRIIKSSRRQRPKQPTNGNGNGYHELTGNWLSYYKVASKYASKAKSQDKEDLLHDIMIALNKAENNNGHKPFTEGTMHRIASHAQADYWRAYYKVNNGLDCHACSKKQRELCRKRQVYPDCPRANRLESLNKPIIDSEGNLTEIGELIIDPDSLEVEAWDRETSIWQIGYKPRLVDIAYKLKAGEALNDRDRQYLAYYRKKRTNKPVLTSRFNPFLTTYIVGALAMPACCGLPDSSLIGKAGRVCPNCQIAKRGLLK